MKLGFTVLFYKDIIVVFGCFASNCTARTMYARRLFPTKIRPLSSVTLVGLLASLQATVFRSAFARACTLTWSEEKRAKGARLQTSATRTEWGRRIAHSAYTIRNPLRISISLRSSISRKNAGRFTHPKKQTLEKRLFAASTSRCQRAIFTTKGKWSLG